MYKNLSGTKCHGAGFQAMQSRAVKFSLTMVTVVLLSSVSRAQSIAVDDLMNEDLQIDGNVMIVYCTEQADWVVIEPHPSQPTHVRVQIQDFDENVLAEHHHSQDTLEAIIVYLNSGDDHSITYQQPNVTVRQIIYGGPGSDTIGGNVGIDWIYGEGGEDYLSGGVGNDLIDGGADSDTMDGQHDDDILFGGDGDDHLGSHHGDDWVFGGAGADHLVSSGTGERLLFGEADNDTIDRYVYDPANDGEYFDTAYGGPGNDTITASVVYGGDGNDVIYGTRGDDVLVGEVGNDTIEGLGGSDFLNGGSGEDTLYGEYGNDNLGAFGPAGVAGNDVIRGGTERDSIWGDNGTDSLYGDDGDDLIWGGQHNDMLDGGNGIDYLFGDSGNDTLYGRNGGDFLTGHSGIDKLYGNEGNDVLIGGTDFGPDNAKDTLTAGQGADQFRVDIKIIYQWINGKQVAIATPEDLLVDYTPGAGDSTF